MPFAMFVPGAAQRHTLIERHITPHDRRLADHHPGAMIDEHPPPDLRSGMNLNPRQQTRNLGEKSPQQPHPSPPEE